MKKWWLTGIFLLFITFPLKAQKKAFVNEYLNLGVGARAFSMGGSNTASTQDVYSGYWNPAGLSRITSDFDLGLMHAEYFAGIFKYDYAALAMPLKDSGRVLALSMIRFATDNIPYTLDYVQPDGSFDDSKLSSFSAGDYALFLSYAQGLPLFKSSSPWKASLGVNGKILYRNVGKMANAWGFGIDAGLQIRNNRWQFGFVAKDLTTTYTAWAFHLTDKEKQVFEKTGNEIPIKSYEVMLPRFNMGIAYQFLSDSTAFGLMAEVGFDLTTDGQRSTLVSTKGFSLDPKMGLELNYKKSLFLRAGISNIQKVLDNTDTLNLNHYTIFQPSVGVGFRVKSLSVDYAFTSLQMQNNPLMSHIISLHLDLFKPENQKKISPTTENGL